MKCRPSEHWSRREFLKGILVSAGGVLPNWSGLFHSQTIAAEAAKQGKRCILLWAAGGASHLETFDMKPGRPTGGIFRPIATNVTGIQVCEYLPRMARLADKLAIVRSMSTGDPGHKTGTYRMHTGYRQVPAVRYPEIGAVVAKFLSREDDPLPSFIQLGVSTQESSPQFGSGFLGPMYQPFRLGRAGALPENTTPYATADSDQRRNSLLSFLDEGFGKMTGAPEAQDVRTAQERSRRLLARRDVFNITSEWDRYRDQYGDSDFGRNCLVARRLVEAGVPFVEVEQPNYDSHARNFECHKGLLPELDLAWSGLLRDLSDRGLLGNTLVVWMGEFGRTPTINNRAGRDHYARVWSMVLAGSGIKTGQVYGASDENGATVRDKPVNEGQLFATIYSALGINHRANHYVGSRPIRVTPDGAQPIGELLA